MTAEPRRFTLELSRLRMHGIDFGGDGAPALALHGHFGCARNFARLAADLQPDWRIIALDQRGHGSTDTPEGVTRGDYVADLAEAIEQLALAPLPLIGHSLGGCNAYAFAAAHPARVTALVVEDIGARIPFKPHIGLDWPSRWPDLAALVAFIDEHAAYARRMLLDSAYELPDGGWGFRFDPRWMKRSRDALTGDWTELWTATDCPALVVRGTRSPVLPADEARRMVELRRSTVLHELDAGHIPHDDRPEEFAQIVRQFLVVRAPLVSPIARRARKDSRVATPRVTLASMSDAVRDLAHDHAEINRRVVALATSLEALTREPGTISAETLAPQLVDLRETLFLHFAREEEGLFPFVAETAPDLADQANEMALAHDAICGTLARMVHLALAGNAIQQLAPLFQRFETAYAAHARSEAALLHALDARLDSAHRTRLADLVHGL
ncbi:MAG TPA: alpha/beta fold hydrolase [Kofleriaceae bacterium]|nr:alpha/beta fold hydrolase [Kofleriaceae bacterium]